MTTSDDSITWRCKAATKRRKDERAEESAGSSR